MQHDRKSHADISYTPNKVTWKNVSDIYFSVLVYLENLAVSCASQDVHFPSHARCQRVKKKLTLKNSKYLLNLLRSSAFCSYCQGPHVLASIQIKCYACARSLKVLVHIDTKGDGSDILLERPLVKQDKSCPVWEAFRHKTQLISCDLQTSCLGLGHRYLQFKFVAL